MAGLLIGDGTVVIDERDTREAAAESGIVPARVALAYNAPPRRAP